MFQNTTLCNYIFNFWTHTQGILTTYMFKTMVWKYGCGLHLKGSWKNDYAYKYANLLEVNLKFLKLTFSDKIELSVEQSHVNLQITSKHNPSVLPW